MEARSNLVIRNVVDDVRECVQAATIVRFADWRHASLCDGMLEPEFLNKSVNQNVSSRYSEILSYH